VTGQERPKTGHLGGPIFDPTPHAYVKHKNAILAVLAVFASFEKRGQKVHFSKNLHVLQVVFGGFGGPSKKDPKVYIFWTKTVILGVHIGHNARISDIAISHFGPF